MLHRRRIPPEEHLAHAGADDKGEDEDNLKCPEYDVAISVNDQYEIKKRKGKGKRCVLCFKCDGGGEIVDE
jgi:hypothetical protein